MLCNYVILRPLIKNAATYAAPLARFVASTTRSHLSPLIRCAKNIMAAVNSRFSHRVDSCQPVICRSCLLFRSVFRLLFFSILSVYSFYDRSSRYSSRSPNKSFCDRDECSSVSRLPSCFDCALALRNPYRCSLSCYIRTLEWLSLLRKKKERAMIRLILYS